MPAAAVIPAPIAYIKVVAVKKLVVELQAWPGGLPNGVLLFGWVLPLGEPVRILHWVRVGEPGLLP